MKDRIRELRKDHLQMTQQAFADRLGFSQNFIWQIEKGDRSPSDRTISDICREFGVREEWLRTGELPMKQSLSRRAQIAKFVADVMKDEKESDTYRILTALVDATPEEICAIVKFARRISMQHEYEKDRP